MNQQSRLSREDVVLAALAPANGGPHTPVQVQKLFFLLDENAAEGLGGRKFHFEPYHYGPFDKDVYSCLARLASRGLVQVVGGSGNWREYRLTPQGQDRGDEILSSLDPQTSSYLKRLSDFVRSLSFNQLVSAVYKAYPRMRARSVFQE
jgi:uncharacterized protein